MTFWDAGKIALMIVAWWVAVCLVLGLIVLALHASQELPGWLTTKKRRWFPRTPAQGTYWQVTCHKRNACYLGDPLEGPDAHHHLGNMLVEEMDRIEIIKKDRPAR